MHTKRYKTFPCKPYLHILGERELTVVLGVQTDQVSQLDYQCVQAEERVLRLALVVGRVAE